MAYECILILDEKTVMDIRMDRIATLANARAYDEKGTSDYIDGAAHIKHASLRALFAKTVIQVYDFAKEHNAVPKVLDLGAGEGSVTQSFLQLGAKVTAVDISSSQLDVLQRKCERFGNRLEVRCKDVNEILRTKSEHFDIIAANSFLHHVPDYLGMIGEAITLLSPWGQFFSFQDPLRYDSVGRFNMMFSTMAYFMWRVFKPDLLGGLKRRIRRSRGNYIADSVYDNAEYHVTRNGVDQDAISQLLRGAGFNCDVVRYFSSQSRIFQPIGTVLGVKNTFAVIARKHK